MAGGVKKWGWPQSGHMDVDGLCAMFVSQQLFQQNEQESPYTVSVGRALKGSVLFIIPLLCPFDALKAFMKGCAESGLVCRLFKIFRRQPPPPPPPLHPGPSGPVVHFPHWWW